MNLLPHNEKAYKMVMWHFRDHNKAAVVHATGTGKSYIIAAVVQHFNHPLIIAPNNFVLNETRKLCPPYCEFETYASNMYKDEFDKYDLIVLDEFHRSGAEKWGKGVNKLIEANPQAKLLGTSATHIRYLDNARNMADEIFDGNVVSHISLAEAIEQKLLPNPTYVTTLYTFQKTASELLKRVDESNYTTDDRKDAARREIMGLAHNWDNAHGVPAIIRKYIKQDTKRVIVFNSRVNRSIHAREMLGKWFSMAGFKKIRFYSIDYKSPRLESEMADFQLDNYEGIKVAMSVNMLNEGIHVPRVDAVIMLRSTISRIIIEQQVGRCLTVDNQRVPVVLDLVNNMDNIGYDFVGFNQEVHNSNGEHKESYDKGLPFNVIDELRDIRLFYEQVSTEFTNRIFYTKEECAETALKYKHKIDFYKAEYNMYQQASRHGWLDEICQHMTPLTHNYTKEECAKEAAKYKKRVEFKRGSGTIYSCALRHKWMDDICGHMTGSVYKYSDEELKEIISNYTILKDLKKNDKKIYNYIVRHNKTYLFDSIRSVKPRKNFTLESAMKMAEELAISCTSVNDFMNKDGGLYNYFRRVKKLDVLHELLDKKKAEKKEAKRQQMRERIFAEAHQCSSYSDFVKNCRYSYNRALYFGCLDEIKALFNKK